jgi:6-phosphogluconolactonase
MKVQRFGSRREIDVALAERLERCIETKLGEAAAIMVTGGRGPLPAYELLGARRLRAASGLHIVYSDERYVPSDSQASNYRASLPLLKGLGLPERQVLRVRTELPLEEAAMDYERRLEELLAAHVRLPFALLGLGADGHIASLFTPDDLERARDRLAISVQRPDGMKGISITPRLLARFEHVLMVVMGAKKQQALAALLAHDPGSVAWRVLEQCRDVEVWCEKES